MKNNIIGFVLSTALAIPTYGLSLIIFFSIKYFIDKSGQEKLAAAVVSSRKENNSSVMINHLNNAAIRKFFRKYGTTEIKYKHTSGISKGLFSGYVNVQGTGEVVVTIIKNSTSVFIKCFDPPMSFGSGMISLMQKSGFHDEIVDIIIKQRNQQDNS